MSGLPTLVLLLIFASAAAAIWIAGIQLSDQTDVLSTRLHLGSALGGLILLAIATNLPEIAITVSAALSHDLGVAVGNILGGIAIQTVVLVVLDAFGVRGKRPLTYRAASLVLVLEGALVAAVLGLVIAGTQMPRSLVLGRVGPVSVPSSGWSGCCSCSGRGRPCRGTSRATPPTGRSRPAGTASRRPRRRRRTRASAPAARRWSSASPPCSPWPRASCSSAAARPSPATSG
jgi:cation:H+ antiporter